MKLLRNSYLLPGPFWRLKSIGDVPKRPKFTPYLLLSTAHHPNYSKYVARRLRANRSHKHSQSATRDRLTEIFPHSSGPTLRSHPVRAHHVPPVAKRTPYFVVVVAMGVSNIRPVIMALDYLYASRARPFVFFFSCFPCLGKLGNAVGGRNS